MKYSFETENISPIEDFIQDFCKSHKKCRYELKGFDHFDKDVIFINVIASKEIKELYSEFIEGLKKKTKIQLKQFDGKTHFHASIAHTDIKEKFDEIWKFATKDKPDFQVLFDNITILKLVNNVWAVHKEYKLK